MHPIKSLLVALALLSVLAYAVGSNPSRNTGVPIVVSVNPGGTLPGHLVQVTVVMDQAPDSDEEVAISASNSNLSNLPSTVTVEEGHDTVTFNATVSSSASGSFTISASAYGHSATSGAVPIYD